MSTEIDRYVSTMTVVWKKYYESKIKNFIYMLASRVYLFEEASISK